MLSSLIKDDAREGPCRVQQNWFVMSCLPQVVLSEPSPDEIREIGHAVFAPIVAAGHLSNDLVDSMLRIHEDVKLAAKQHELSSGRS